MSAQPQPLQAPKKTVFRLLPDPTENGALKPFPDPPKQDLHVHDEVVYSSPDGIVELRFVEFDNPSNPASPFQDGAIKVTSGAPGAETEPKLLDKAGHFFCLCAIIRGDGSRVEWKDSPANPKLGRGADHDIRPPQP